MRYIFLLLIVFMFQAGLAQITNTKVIRIADVSTTFSQPLSEGNILIDLSTDKCYLILKGIAGTNSITDLTLNIDYKEISVAEYQTLDIAQLNGTKLELSLSGDGETTHQIELGSLSGGTGDSTFVTVTTDTLFVADNISYVDSAHGVKINNNLTIEADGTIRMDNEATVWNDLNVFPDAVNNKGASAPVYEVFRDNGSGSVGVWLNWFEDSKEQEVFFTIQLPHAYKEGTDLHPHVHWTTKAGTPSSTDVKWGLEYTVVSVGSTFGNTTTLYGTSVIPPVTPTGTHQHLINSLGTISGTGLTLSAILSCRLFRAGTDAEDTFTEKAGLLGIDFHYEEDTQGSRLEFAK